MDSDDVAKLLETARMAALQAGELLRDRWLEPQNLMKKGFRDWVTDTDFAAQELIIELIRQRHPDHGFLAEESGTALPAEGEVRWIVDPIDGTTNYSRQQPNFCISIAAASEERTLAGVILDPLRRELFGAAAGAPAFMNEQAIRVSSTPQLDNAVVGFDWAHSPQARQATLDSLQNIGHGVRSLRSIGSAALALAWVAAGRLDGYWNWQLNAWDLAAGALIIERAGGLCTRLEGGPLTASVVVGSCLASNSVLHAALGRRLVAISLS